MTDEKTSAVRKIPSIYYIYWVSLDIFDRYKIPFCLNAGRAVKKLGKTKHKHQNHIRS